VQAGKMKNVAAATQKQKNTNFTLWTSIMGIG